MTDGYHFNKYWNLHHEATFHNAHGMIHIIFSKYVTNVSLGDELLAQFLSDTFWIDVNKTVCSAISITAAYTLEREIS
jgi:hypothetical protein